MQVVKDMRYGGDNYLWINDLQPRMIMHPIKPELDGQDMSGFTDPKGKKLFVEMARTAQEKGHGVVEYLWKKSGEGRPVPKLSFVQLLPEWGWIVGTGIYTDDIDVVLAVQQDGGIRSVIDKQRVLLMGTSLVLILIVGCCQAQPFGGRFGENGWNVQGLNSSPRWQCTQE